MPVPVPVPPAARTDAQAHLAQLDVLRGIAALAVFFHHNFTALFPPESVWPDWSPFRLFIPYRFGYLGVQLFFVLSGYCIHKSFLGQQERFENGEGIRWRTFLPDFLTRRFFRIYPAYFAALLLFILVMPRVDGFPNEWIYLSPSNIWAHVLLVHNLFQGPYYSINASFWSLGVEMQLYFLYPLLLQLRHRVGYRAAFGCAALVSVANWAVEGRAPFFVANGPFHYWYIWAAGAWLAESHHRGVPLFPSRGRWLAGLFLAWLLVCSRPSLSWIDNLLIALFFTCLIESYLHRKTLNAAEKGLARLGLVSYSFYLLHQPFVSWGQSLFTAGHGGFGWSLLALTGVMALIFIPIFLLSLLFYYGIEWPTHRIGKKLAAFW